MLKIQQIFPKLYSCLLYVVFHNLKPQNAGLVDVKKDLNSKRSKGIFVRENRPGRVAQSVGHLTRKSGVLGSIPGLATYFRFSFRFFKKGSCQLLAKVCARSTG